MTIYLTQKDLICFINDIKREAMLDYVGGEVIFSLDSLVHLHDNLSELSKELSVIQETFLIAKEIGLEDENRSFILQGFMDLSNDFYFKIRSAEIGYLQKMVAKQAIRLEKIKSDLDHSYQKLYQSVKIEKFNNPLDSFFLSQIMFGTGRFVISAEKKALFYSFNTVLDKTGDIGGMKNRNNHLLFFNLNPEIAYIHGSLKKTILEEPHMDYIIISSSKINDSEMLIRIAAQKYVNIFSKAARENDYLINNNAYIKTKIL